MNTILPTTHHLRQQSFYCCSQQWVPQNSALNFFLDALLRECCLQSWQVVLLNKLRKRLVFQLPVLSRWQRSRCRLFTWEVHLLFLQLAFLTGLVLSRFIYVIPRPMVYPQRHWDSPLDSQLLDQVHLQREYLLSPLRRYWERVLQQRWEPAFQRALENFPASLWLVGSASGQSCNISAITLYQQVPQQLSGKIIACLF